jgi:hypothetical protein
MSIGEKILSKAFYRVLSMPVHKKIILDQNVQSPELMNALAAVGVDNVYTIAVLGLDPNKETDDRNIEKKMTAFGKKTPNSGYLFITKNAKDFAKKPNGYDVLWVPDKIKVKEFAESFRTWLSLSIPLVARNKIYEARVAGGKYDHGYAFDKEVEFNEFKRPTRKK